MDDFLQPSIGHPFTVGILHLDLHLPECRSLKEKRGRLARVMSHVRKKHAVVIAEVGDQDVWGRAGLAATTLSTDRNLVMQILEAAADTVASQPDVELLRHEIELI
ncbi:DUF503 domain-containing protein [bacterium]|nr:DUF503 domain-containing protein [bacterium]